MIIFKILKERTLDEYNEYIFENILEKYSLE